MSKTKKKIRPSRSTNKEEQYHKLWREYIDAVRSRKIIIEK